MDTKQMSMVDLNAVFGNKEEPLTKYIESIVLPALTSGIQREGSDGTTYLFEEVKISEIEDNEFVIQGLIIKNTILEVKSEYTNENGLEKTDKKYKSSPYSLFMLYLKNHRIVLVKNQKGSPDTRAFIATFRDVLRQYIRNENEKRKEEGENKLPYCIVNAAGIKTAQSVKESLKDVEKITQLIVKFHPLNAEWDYNPVFEGINERIRKTIKSKKGRMIFNSPESKEGVAEFIEETAGIVETEMKVRYKTDSSYSGTKKTGTIKDSQITDSMNIDINSELDNAYEEINRIKKDIKIANVCTENHIIDYTEFVKTRNKSR